MKNKTILRFCADTKGIWRKKCKSDTEKCRENAAVVKGVRINPKLEYHHLPRCPRRYRGIFELA